MPIAGMGLGIYAGSSLRPAGVCLSLNCIAKVRHLKGENKSVDNR